MSIFTADAKSSCACYDGNARAAGEIQTIGRNLEAKLDQTKQELSQLTKERCDDVTQEVGNMRLDMEAFIEMTTVSLIY